MDMTVRTDSMLANLFEFIDWEVGLSNSVIVLTSDHGIAPVPEYILAHAPRADAGRLPRDSITAFCNASLTKAFGMPKVRSSWVKRVMGNNIYLDRDILRDKKLSVDAAANALADSLSTMADIAASVSRQHMTSVAGGTVIEQKMSRSFYPQRSGDVIFALKPYVLPEGGTTGTTHGQPYDYDAHVPLIIVGEGIHPGTYAAEASPADIAPTLSALLGIEFPAGREGRVLIEALSPR
jgi:arylsulfatase A-like enzyme